MKEDFTPTGADPIVFTWAPVVTYLASVMTLLVIPFAPGLFGQDLNLGLLYFFAIGGLSVVGLLMAGWSSYNKYSLLGGLRSAAQVISYEIPLTLSVVGIDPARGHDEPQPDRAQTSPAGSPTGTSSSQPLGFLIFFIAATAEANRTPFDLTEADSEIVAGFATEYSGMRFGFFFFAEYVNVFIISALTVTLFFGGWNAPFPWPWPVELIAQPGSLGHRAADPRGGRPADPDLRSSRRRSGWPAPGSRGGRRCSAASSWPTCSSSRSSARSPTSASTGSPACCGSCGKTFAFVFIFVWMRGTLPRVRIDQLMDFAWKWLLPASLLNLFAHRGGHRHRRNREAVLMSMVPGLGIAKGMALTLRRFFEPKVTVMYPEDRARPAAQVPRPAAAAVRRVGHAQVRDLLPVRTGLPDRMHRHGRDGHARAATTSTGARPRRTASGARNRRSGGPAGRSPTPPTGRSRRSTWPRSTRSSRTYDHDPAFMLQILEATQAAYGYLPVAALKRISQGRAPGTR